MKLSLSKGKLLALDWDRRTLRMVLVRPRADGVDLIKASSVAIPGTVRTDEADSLGAFVRQAMSEVGISATRAMLSIPRDHVVLNTLDLPPTPAEEMPSIVQFQIAKELPFAAEEATLDYAVSGEFDPKSSCNVLVAAVRNDQLNFYKKVAETAGLTIDRIGLRPFANLIAVTAKAPELNAKSMLLVEIGPQFTEIDVIRQGKMMFSRAALLTLPEHGAESGEAFTDSRISTTKQADREEDGESQQAVNDLMVEIVRSVEAYRATDPTVSLDHIVVCGATGFESLLVQALAARYATMATLYTPDRAMELAPQRAKELRGFNAALGLAIGHARKGQATIDFLHPKRPISRRSVQMRKLPVAVATALLFVGSGVTFHVRFIKPLQDEAKRLDVDRAKMKKQEEPITRFKEQVESLENWVASEQHWPRVLTMVTEVFPAETEAYSTRADFEVVANPKSSMRDATMKLRFRTTSLGTVNSLAGKLREAGFSNVVPGKETPSEMGHDGYRYDTNIDAAVPSPKSQEASLPDKADEKPSEPAKSEPAKTEAAKPSAAKPEGGKSEIAKPTGAKANDESHGSGDKAVPGKPTEAAPSDSHGPKGAER